jgi:hypothetical protein
MMVSVRLNGNLARQLGSAARTEGITKSELIRRCLEERFSRRDDVCPAWELGKDLFGRHGSGDPNLARNRKRILREKFRAFTSRG